MYMVKCSPKYWEFVLDLRNNMRQYFFSQFMLESIKGLYPDATAQILAENISSIRLFESAKIPLEIIE